MLEERKCLKRGKAAGPDGIMNEMLIYRGGRLVEVKLLMVNVLMKGECCPLDWKEVYWYPSTKMMMWNK